MVAILQLFVITSINVRLSHNTVGQGLALRFSLTEADAKRDKPVLVVPLPHLRKGQPARPWGWYSGLGVASSVGGSSLTRST